MTEYGICDIGSNTIVLIVYELINGKPVQKLYRSTPAHLIDYVDSNRFMSKDGIKKVCKVLDDYRIILDERNIKYRWADVTEPCRIENRDDFIDACSKYSFEIHPLTGEQEASLDYLGTQLSWPNIKDGIAFDVGGGSTELISFKDSKAVQAISFHLGCVRLAHLPLDTDACRDEIEKARKKYQSLHTSSVSLIGIGGTMRAVTMTMDSLYHCGNAVSVRDLKELFRMLCLKDEKTLKAVEQTVDPARIPVFLPGIHMIIAICDAFDSDTVFFSVTGIREGFLLDRLSHLSLDFNQ
jgi:exopolyphosphatase/guanosine-5'-triphosphate,3'-diphosphate pyrophosphatase